jgi:superfamily II DNA or RNA helicase
MSTTATLSPPKIESSQIDLRWYQQAAYDEAQGALSKGLRPLICLPTGAGKTIVAKAVVHDWVSRGKRVLFLAHRIELISQARQKVGDPNGFNLSTVQGFAGQSDADLIIIDECHHTPAETYRDICAAHPKALVAGLTATPDRADRKGLKPYFDVMVCPTNVAQLTSQKYLAPMSVYVPETQLMGAGLKVGRSGDFTKTSVKESVRSDIHIDHAIGQYRRHADGLRGLVFCVDVDHSKRVAGFYQAAGIKAVSIDGNSPQLDRARVRADWEKGAIDVICNCELFTEGVDLPSVDFVQCLRPTQSIPLWFQMLGRGMRPGNRDVVILDHTDNTQRLGLPIGVEGYDLTNDGESPMRMMPGVKRQVVGDDGLLVDSDEDFEPPIDLAKIDLAYSREKVLKLLQGDEFYLDEDIASIVGVSVTMVENRRKAAKISADRPLSQSQRSRILAQLKDEYDSLNELMKLRFNCGRISAKKAREFGCRPAHLVQLKEELGAKYSTRNAALEHLIITNQKMSDRSIAAMYKELMSSSIDPATVRAYRVRMSSSNKKIAPRSLILSILAERSKHPGLSDQEFADMLSSSQLPHE